MAIGAVILLVFITAVVHASVINTEELAKRFEELDRRELRSRPCPVNEVFKSCGHSCDSTRTCQRKYPRRCPDTCVANACNCISGTAREFEGGSCVPLDDCDEYALTHPLLKGRNE